MFSKWAIIGLVVVVLAFSAVIIVLAPQMINPSQQGIFQGEEVEGAGLTECNKPAILYVYNNTKQQVAGKNLVELLRQSLAQQGIKADVCSVDAKTLGLDLRAYPALLIYGDIPALEGASTLSLGDYKLLDYGILVWLSDRLGLEMTYKYRAHIYVVDGETKWGKARNDINTLLKALEKYILAKIDSVERISIADLGKLGVNKPPTIYPTVIVVSENPIDEGTSYMIKLGSNAYGFKTQLAAELARLLRDGSGYEIHYKPDLTKLPGWGSMDAKLQLLIFEDYACPYCRAFYEKLYPELREMIYNGTIRFSVVDFIIHEDVRPLHKLTYCLYNITSDGRLLEETILEIYKIFGSKGKPPSEDDMLLKLKKKVGKDLIDRILDCSYSENADQYLSESKELAATIGARGTPTIVIWRSENTIGVVVPGLPQKEELLEIINYFLSTS